MKKDIRKQTFSKPEKPSDEEIKRLTSDENILPPEAEEEETKVSVKTSRKKGSPAVVKTDPETTAKVETQIVTSIADSSNPFLLSRGLSTEIRIEKTGYRLRADYMDLLKLVKRMKKGYTLEAVLDDALTFYFENSEDGQTAVKHRQVLDSIENA